MEAAPRNFKQNFFDRAKSFFHHLRWFFCLSTPEESKDVPSKIGKNDHLQLIKGCKPKTFVDLPTECKLKIFSFLTAQEKGLARLVCLEWKDLLKACVLWQNVDLTSIKLVCKCSEDECKNADCYEDYKRRMRKFVDFIAIMQPHVKCLKFSFDVIDCDDSWSDMLHSLLDSVHANDIHTADIDWMNTSEKPGLLTVNDPDVSENISDLLLKQRRRHRRFENFFDFFTQLSYRLKHLSLPFEWTERSLHLLCRLNLLETLILRQCSDNHSKLEQKFLNQLTQALPNLKHLAVEATFSDSFVVGHLFPSSKSLQVLNLENCTGVVFTGFDLPSLIEICVGKKQAKASFVDQNVASLPCLHDLLADGAPKLRLFNGYYLQEDWKVAVRDEVSVILSAACSCPLHKTD